MADDSATRVSETPAEENAPKETSAEVNASDAAPAEATADEPKATNGTSDEPEGLCYILLSRLDLLHSAFTPVCRLMLDMKARGI